MISAINITKNSSEWFRVRPLNSNKHIQVAMHNLNPMCSDPVDIPLSPRDVGATLLTGTLSPEDIEKLWSPNSDSTTSEYGSLRKHKARLCCHGGQQQWGLNHWDTYAPVVSWFSIRILLVLSKLHNLHTKSVAFVQAYPQAMIKSTIFL